MECPHNRLAKALHVLSFLNRDDTGQTAHERQCSFNTKAHPRPPVRVKDLQTGEWKGALDLLTWGRGYACVSTGHQVKWNSLRVCAALCHTILIPCVYSYSVISLGYSF